MHRIFQIFVDNLTSAEDATECSKAGVGAAICADLGRAEFRAGVRRGAARRAGLERVAAIGVLDEARGRERKVGRTEMYAPRKSLQLMREN
jgi:hypothetical protein